MRQSARDKFYERMRTAPLAAGGFFESVEEHFRPRKDVKVRCTYANGADMRLWAVWENSTSKQREQVFATMTWQPNNLAVFARTMLTPEEFVYFGFEGASKPKAASEPLNSDMHLFEVGWRFGALPFIRALEAARIKLTD